MDIIEASTGILSLATNGASYTRIVAVNHHIMQDEITWLLKMLVNKSLLELDSSATYWTTVNGVKVLELQFNMEQILQVQKSLI